MNAGLKDLIDPSYSALLVIDVQNDSCHSDGYYAKTGKDISLRQKAAHNVAEFIERVRKYKVPVIYTKASHSRWDQSVARLKRREGVRIEACMEGTWGADFYAVQPVEGEAVILKQRYSAFKGTNLDMILRSRGISTLIVTGGGTQACVESTVRDAYEFDYDVVVVSDCCGTPALDEHEPALRRMARLCGRVAESRELLDVWSQG